MNLKKAEKAVKNAFIKFLAGLIPLDREPERMPDFASLRSITVIRPDRLGDFTLCVPAIAAIADNMHPDCVLNVLCGTRGKELAKTYFGKHNVIVYEKNFISFLKICFYLLLTKHNAVVNFHSYPFSMTSAIFTMFTKSPVRVGFKETELVKNVLAPKVFNKGIVLNDDSLHEMEKDILLIKKLGCPYDEAKLAGYLEAKLPEENASAADKFCAESGINKNDKVIGIHPSLLKADNRWEKSNYVMLCAMIKSAQPETKIVAIHGMGEENEILKFKELAGDSVLYYPQNDILSLMAIASLMNALVCNDSGVMHACSLMTKVIAIFGPSTLSRWSPIGAHGNITIQKPDGKCDSVSPAEVMVQIKKRI